MKKQVGFLYPKHTFELCSPWGSEYTANKLEDLVLVSEYLKGGREVDAPDLKGNERNEMRKYSFFFFTLPCNFWIRWPAFIQIFGGGRNYWEYQNLF